VAFRDERGVVYDSVTLPNHEVTVAVAVDARIVSRSTVRKAVPFYTGTDGAELAQQPHLHRRQWTDPQWLAFEEHRHVEAELFRDDEPVAATMIIRPHAPVIR
jgi:hypothetical protein